MRCSRMWRRMSVPPVPALIPIAAVRPQQRRHSHSDFTVNNEVDVGVSMSSNGRTQETACMDTGAVAGSEDVDMESGSDREVFQRSWRRLRQPNADTEPIDAVTPSRDLSGPQAPTRRPRPERHRKSDHRRHKSDRLLRKRYNTTTITTLRPCDNTLPPSSFVVRKPRANPRVNPIFVWVRQENTRIVDVKCEDYDKRNRILLTKTAQGWRAIPRTETLGTGTIEDSTADTTSAESGHRTKLSALPRKPRNRKSGRTRRWRTSAQPEPEPPPFSSPTWNSASDVESHLPSHTIPVPARHLHELAGDVETHSVNSDDAQAPSLECCAASVVNGVSSPLDNLLAVAELEFKQHQNQEQQQSHMEDDISQSDCTTPCMPTPVSNSDGENEHEHKEHDFNIEIKTLSDMRYKDATGKTEIEDDCDYNEDDENHMAMTDILDRLEQSLQSPLEDEQHETDTEQEHNTDPTCNQEQDQEIAESGIIDDDADDCNISIADDEQQNFVDSTEELQMMENGQPDKELEITKFEDVTDEQLVSSGSEYDILITETNDEENCTLEQSDDSEQPTDLSNKNTSVSLKESISVVAYDDELPTDLSKKVEKEELSVVTEEHIESVEEIDDLQPTDLSMRKTCSIIEPTRPPSQNSETIQSPQPSGIPAVPSSPDLYHGNKVSSGTGMGNCKSLFLETLLSSASPKLALTSEVSITINQKEPLDLGKSRKSASPTVSCSEEAKEEPVTKRVKIEDITLKNLLNVEKQRIIKPVEAARSEIGPEKSDAINSETSRLLELLTSNSEPNPLTQLKQLLVENEVSIPDPLLVPKDRLSSILSSPSREIPRLLTQRPELRLPEALAHPQLLQDPDILVITLAQLQTILHKQNQPLNIEETMGDNNNIKERDFRKSHQVEKLSSKSPKTDELEKGRDKGRERYQLSQLQPPIALQQSMPKVPNGLASEIDAATTAAFNQMLWLPYLNHLEAAALAYGNNPEFIKALNSVCTLPVSYATTGLQDTISPPTFSGGRFPGISGAGFPSLQPPSMDYTNPLELAMWQEAMLQANLQQQQQQQRSNNIKQSTYRDSLTYNNQKKYHSSTTNQRVHSSARTSPISHTFHQQRISSNGHTTLPLHPYGYPSSGMRHNLQIPHYNPSSLTLQQQALLQQHHHQQLQQQHTAAAAVVKKSSSISPSSSATSTASYRKSSSDILKQYQNNAYSKHAYNILPQQSTQSQTKVSSFPNSKPPRVTCKSLHNLLSPKRIEETPAKVAKPSQPMDLSGARLHVYSKLKVKQNLMDPVSPSLGTKLWRHEDVPEVGSTTEEMSLSTHHLHDSQTHLWHPLFGK